MRNQPSKSKPTFEEGQHVYHEGYGHGYCWGWRRKERRDIGFGDWWVAVHFYAGCPLDHDQHDNPGICDRYGTVWVHAKSLTKVVREPTQPGIYQSHKPDFLVEKLADSSGWRFVGSETVIPWGELVLLLTEDLSYINQSTKSQHYVYAIYGEDGSCLYVGQTQDLKRRQAEHRSNPEWGSLISRVEVVAEADHPSLADIQERHFIHALQPKHNAIRYEASRRAASVDGER